MKLRTTHRFGHRRAWPSLLRDRHRWSTKTIGRACGSISTDWRLWWKRWLLNRRQKWSEEISGRRIESRDGMEPALTNSVVVFCERLSLRMCHYDVHVIEYLDAPLTGGIFKGTDMGWKDCWLCWLCSLFGKKSIVRSRIR